MNTVFPPRTVSCTDRAPTPSAMSWSAMLDLFDSQPLKQISIYLKLSKPIYRLMEDPTKELLQWPLRAKPVAGPATA